MATMPIPTAYHNKIICKILFRPAFPTRKAPYSVLKEPTMRKIEPVKKFDKSIRKIRIHILCSLKYVHTVVVMKYRVFI